MHKSVQERQRLGMQENRNEHKRFGSVHVKRNLCRK